jgi:undecaprenyl-diphosphatase
MPTPSSDLLLFASATQGNMPHGDVTQGEMALLGVVQGLTEFLPVSSSGHLAVGQMWLGLTEGNLTLSVMLHAGTLVATVVFFRARLRRLFAACAEALLRPASMFAAEGQPAPVRDAVTIVLASVPTALVGFTMKDTVERWTTSPAVVGVGFLITAAVLWSTRYVPLRAPEETAGEHGDHPSRIGALVVGCAQAVAIAPGISRSGMTIAALLWLGVRPGRSFELSMLVSLPAVLGAFLLEARHVSAGTHAVSMGFGALVSFFVGLVALWLLRGVVTRGRFFWFVFWVIPLAVATLVTG